MPDAPVIAWCRDPAVADAAATLFVADADPAYISHGELQGGRAVAPDTWAADIGDQIRATVRQAAATPPDGDGLRLVVMTDGATLVGFALVRFADTATRPWAVLDDLVLDAGTRGRGVGTAFMAWLEAELRARGVGRVFLESGRSNAGAHNFFARHGFRPVSVVMMREL